MGLRVIELFAGVGGFRLGLEGHPEYDSFDGSGHEVVWSNQWEPEIKAQHASNCYAEQFGEEGHTNVDIAEVDAEEVPDHDLLTAGFPCQDYSVATPQAPGIKGKKGVLWWHIERIARKKRPPFLLLENVNRLLKSPTDQRGRDFGVLLRCLADLGYRAEWRVINAAEYGYAQKRRRVFIFAAHEDTSWGQHIAEDAEEPGYITESGFFSREFPILRENGTLDTPRAPDGTLPEDLEKTNERFELRFDKTGVMVDGEIWHRDYDADGPDPTPLREKLQSDVDEKYYVPEDKLDKWEYAKGAKKEKRVTDEGYEYHYEEGGMNFPDDIDKPARTILTSEGGTTGSRSKHIIEDPESGELRTLTPVECERLQGFPDGWTEGMPENWRYKCMGNALVVGLVEQMGEVLRRTVTEAELKEIEASEAKAAAEATA